MHPLSHIRGETSLRVSWLIRSSLHVLRILFDLAGTSGPSLRFITQVSVPMQNQSLKVLMICCLTE